MISNPFREAHFGQGNRRNTRQKPLQWGHETVCTVWGKHHRQERPSALLLNKMQGRGAPFTHPRETHHRKPVGSCNR